MNGFLDWLRSSTHGITEALRQCLLWAIGLGLITHDFRGREWTDVHTVLTISAASAVLSLIASKTTVAANKVSERVEQAHARGVAAGVAQVTSGTGNGIG